MSKRCSGEDVPVVAKKPRMQNGSSNTTNTAAVDMEIDEDLHSRQLAVYGKESMRRMAASNVLICGALGPGVEAGNRTRHRRSGARSIVVK